MINEFKKWFAARARNPDRITLEEAYQAGLQAKIEAVEKQEPVAWLHVGSCYGEELEDWEFEADRCACDKLNELYAHNPMSLPLYTLPGAQPAPSVPDGWKLVPIEPTGGMVAAGSWGAAAGMRDPDVVELWKDMLAAAPEGKA